MAGEGVLSNQAVAQSPWTMPSIASVLTSLYPPHHGLLSFGDSIKADPVIIRALQANGYYTVGICANKGVSENKEMSGWFNEFYAFSFGSKEFWRVYDAKKVTQAALKQINKNRQRRFFLWLHYMDTHGPYNPPAPYDRKWVSEADKGCSAGLPISEHKWLGFKGVPKYMTYFMDINNISREKFIGRYDGAVSFLDAQIGVLLKEIKKSGINAVVIITSDHGESFGEHGYFGHEVILYDELIMVPLIIWSKNGIFPHRLVREQVKGVDIMPTVLDILKMPLPVNIDGESLLPLIGNQKTTGHADYAFICYDNFIHRYAIRSNDGFKLIYTREGDKYELYDLKHDPAEANNLVNEQVARFKFLKNILLRWIDSNYASSGKKVDPADAETKKELRSLGYLQ